MARATEASGQTVDEAVDKALAELGLRRDQVDVDVVTEGRKGGFLRAGEPAVVRVTAIEAAPAEGGARVSRETSEGDDDESRPRRRRGRRGGRRRRGGEGGEGGEASNGGGADSGDGDDRGGDRDGAGRPAAAASLGGIRTGSDAVATASRGDDDDDDSDRGPRGGGRGGRNARGGRGRGGSASSGGGSSSRGGGRSRDREERSGEPIIGVSDEDAIPIPGTPEELPYSPIEDPADDVDLAGSTLRDVLTLLGYVETQITAREPETPGDGTGLIEQIFDIYGANDEVSDELGVLIGRRGETLSAVQYLVNTIVSKGGNKPPVFGVDIEGYRRRREEMLVDLARDIAQEVRETGDVITLEPMPAHERRIVHIALREEAGVRTESVGSGENRQVEILPED